MQDGGDLGEVQIVLPDHLLALLELDPADVFAGGDLQILVEEHRQIAGADTHLVGHHGDGQLFPDVPSHILLGQTDDLVFVLDDVGILHLTAGRGLGLPQQIEQQQCQLGYDDVRGEAVHMLLLPQHALQQIRGGLGGGEFSIQQRRQLHAAHVEGDGDKPGGHADVGVLHVPLVGAVDYQVALLQQQILPLHHGVQLSLVHIGQLRHGMGLTGEQEALLLLLVEEGIDAVYVKLLVLSQPLHGLGAEEIRPLRRGVHQHAGAALEGAEGELHTLFQGNGLVQVEMQILILSAAHGKNGHACASADPGVGLRLIDGRTVAVQRNGLHLLPGNGRCAVGAFRQHGSVAAEIDLIQIPYHGAEPPALQLKG